MILHSLKKCCLLILVFALIICINVISVHADEEYFDYSSALVRIGLYYSSTALDSVNISNSGGFSVFLSEDDEYPTSIDVSMLHVEAKNGNLCVSTIFGGDIVSAGNGNKIYIYSTNPDDVVSVNGASYYGAFELYADANGKIVVINAISIDDYLKGVLPSEVYPSWHMEALKAAAVVSRTYALRNAANSSHTASGFDICATTHCQMYSGTVKVNERTNQAIAETEGQIITYNGALAMTPYHSSNGGYTETAAGAWGGSPDAYPYLTNVFTPYEDYRNVPNGKWESIIYPANLIEYIPETYKSKLKGSKYSFDYTREPSGFIGKMTVADEYGNTLDFKTSGGVRGFFGSLVKSANFGIANAYIPTSRVSGAVTVISAQGEREITGIDGYQYITSSGTYTCSGFDSVYVFDGQGYGHGVGLSQFGSRCMADAGFTYDEIIHTYFPGTLLTSVFDFQNY